MPSSLELLLQVRDRTHHCAPPRHAISDVERILVQCIQWTLLSKDKLGMRVLYFRTVPMRPCLTGPSRASWKLFMLQSNKLVCLDAKREKVFLYAVQCQYSILIRYHRDTFPAFSCRLSREVHLSRESCGVEDLKKRKALM